jgi:hypothetical protein
MRPNINVITITIIIIIDISTNSETTDQIHRPRPLRVASPSVLTELGLYCMYLRVRQEFSFPRKAGGEPLLYLYNQDGHKADKAKHG